MKISTVRIANFFLLLLLTIQIVGLKAQFTQSFVSEFSGLLPQVTVGYHLKPTILFTTEIDPQVISRQPIVPSL